MRSHCRCALQKETRVTAESFCPAERSRVQDRKKIETRFQPRNVKTTQKGLFSVVRRTYQHLLLEVLLLRAVSVRTHAPWAPEHLFFWCLGLIQKPAGPEPGEAMGPLLTPGKESPNFAPGAFFQFACQNFQKLKWTPPRGLPRPHPTPLDLLLGTLTLKRGGDVDVILRVQGDAVLDLVAAGAAPDDAPGLLGDVPLLPVPPTDARLKVGESATSAKTNKMNL